MTTHAIYIDARRPEAQFSLRIMGYSASSVEISVLNGAALADLTGQGIALWYGPVPATGEPQLGHTVTGTVTASGCAVVDLALADTGYEGRLVAQVVSIVDGVSSVLGSGEIWMLANPARDTLPMTFDAPPWATADDIDAAISARVAGVEDLPDEPTYDQIIALLRAVLSALKGAATIALAMLALGAGAQTSRLGSLRAGDVVVTNEQDALAYPVATNALALASTALKPAATNGLLTAEVDPVWAVESAAVTNHTSSNHGLNSLGGFYGGFQAFADSGGAIGNGAYTYVGGSVGYGARSNYGGAVGFHAATGDGFAGGYNATTYGEGFSQEDAIQLGTGNNPNPLTLQVYGWPMLDSGGEIPMPRMAAVSNWVESIRGVHADIASNVVYHVVVSNGHWLIREVQ